MWRLWEKVCILCKRSSKQFCQTVYRVSWVQNRKMTFSPAAVHTTEPLLWKGMRMRTAALFLPFQKLPIQQRKGVRRSTGGQRTWVQSFPPYHSAWEQRATQPDPLPASGSSRAGQELGETVLPTCCGWGACGGTRDPWAQGCPPAGTQGYKPLNAQWSAPAAASLHHCFKDSEDTEHYWLHLLCPLLSHPCPPHTGTSNFSHGFPAPAGDDCQQSLQNKVEALTRFVPRKLGLHEQWYTCIFTLWF